MATTADLTLFKTLLPQLSQPVFLIQGGRIVLRSRGSAPAEQALQQLLREPLPQENAVISCCGWTFQLQQAASSLLVIAQQKDETAPPQPAPQALRTPLSNLFAAASLLFPRLEDEQDPEIQRQTALMAQSLYRIFRQVNNFDCLSAPLRGVRRRGDLRQMLQDLAEELIPVCRMADVTFDYHLPPQQLYLDFEPQLIERAVLNLVANGMQFSPKGAPLTLGLQSGRAQAVITLHSAGQVPELASFFDQAPTQSLDPAAGAGLGLRVVRKIAQFHQGTLLCQQQSSGLLCALSISAQPAEAPAMHSVQYDDAGGFHHLLLELSDVLPVSCYRSEAIF